MQHPWQPVYDDDSRVLVLGSFPSPRSRERGFYYGHPQNLFWQMLADSLHALRLAPDASREQRIAFLTEKRVALWDVLHSCDVVGAADSRISNPVPNRFAPLLAATRITTVFTTGRTATNLFNRLCAREAGLRAVYLPSTSPANRAQQSRPEFGALWANVGRVMRAETISSRGMKLADQRTISELGVSSLTLMERAAQAVAEALLNTRNGFDLSCVTCVCGAGNNGGDGFAIARLLRGQGLQVQVVFVGNVEKASAETRQQMAWTQAAGVPICTGVPSGGGTAPGGRILGDDSTAPGGRAGDGQAGELDGRLAATMAALREPDERTGELGERASELNSGAVEPNGWMGELGVLLSGSSRQARRPTTIVDALFGIGLTRPLRGDFLKVVRAINASRRTGARVLAVDVPSGISADTGEVLGDAVRADMTVTFAASKLGLELDAGRVHAGKVAVANIGIEARSR